MKLESKTKSICMIAMSYYPQDPRIRREAEALEKAGYDVDILCRIYPKQSKSKKFGKITAYRIMNAPRQESQIKFIITSFLFTMVSFFWLQILVIKKRYDLIQVHNPPDYLIFACVIQKLFGIKLVLDIHDPSVDLYEEKWPGKRNRIIKRLVKLIERISCNMSDHVITVTASCKERLVERGVTANKITLILNSADEKIFNIRNNRDFNKITQGVKLLYHGTIAERFGLHIAIEAMDYLREKISDCRLNIFGRYVADYKELLESLIYERKLNDHIFLNGVLRREEIPGVISQNDIGLIPYINNEFMSIALPTKAFEYIASGLPVVGSRLGELSNTFSDKSIKYFEAGNAKDLSDKIEELCLNYDLCRNQGKEALKELSGISGSVMEERYVKLIDKLTEKK